ncbi:MAG: four helix bundle protein [Patescibacteria group bacterium]
MPDYDLAERTKKFSTEVIRVLKKIKFDQLNQNIIFQLLKSATSIGANYREANGASSKKDFKNKIAICRKEAQETEYWIELLAETNSENKNNLQKIWKEAHELTLIFGKIFSTLKN